MIENESGQCRPKLLTDGWVILPSAIINSGCDLKNNNNACRLLLTPYL